MGQIKNDRLLTAVKLVLKELRLKTGLTQEKVANDIKANKNLTIHIGRNESGNLNISISTLFEICTYYEISISEFFKRVEEIDKDLKITNHK
ncbi:helix-turn-helix domain-containing protein [Flavobacterium humidisoli]|uniref:Helix-turn-helix domain-containing protein n=1 Tax=Flavobacterium humidisoli TaxID=2937442 RepID=A0ABY4LYX9_9FLAO|nr:helix-turn-helix transcriptional regulator [Flavobacterium humidisoli]UPZ18022.1 helix-turn-helix domain-containing protein [Flavobacterium humidisoli]